MSDAEGFEARVLQAGPVDPAVRDAWRVMAAARGSAFISPEWSDAWSAAYGDTGELVTVVVIGRDQRLAGVMPLVLSKTRPRRWRFAGANTADILEPASEPGMERAVAQVALGAVMGRAGLAVLDNVPDGSGWVEAASAGRYALSYRHARLPYIDLTALESWNDYLATRSRNMRSQVRRRERALARDHELNFRMTRDAAELQDDLSTFFRLHYARWADRGGSTSASEAARAFHSSFAAAALQQGWLRLWTCEVDGAAVASWYGWRVGNRYSYYLAGFDPAWAEKGVGGVLLAHTIRSAIEEGAGRYELLLGDEAYKQRYATDAEAVRTVVLMDRWHPARPLVSAEVRIWHAAQRLSPARRQALRKVVGRAAALLPGSRTR